MASNSKRAFNLKYLEMYDWMMYSPKHKGVFVNFVFCSNLIYTEVNKVPLLLHHSQNFIR